MVTRCIFCGRSDLSREHVWSTWTHEYIRKPHNPKVHISRQFSISSVTKIKKEVGFKQRQGDVTTIQLKVVCKNHCNAGWMSRLETRVKPVLIPLFKGSPFLLNKYNQEILATWIAMKLMVAEFSVPEDTVTPQIERTLLMRRRRPPDVTGIWIGHYKGTGWGNVYLRNAATLGWAPFGTIPKAPAKGSFAKNTQLQTFFIGELFVQAVTVTIKELAFQTPPSAPYLRQIWPFQFEFSWPPATAMHDFHAHLMATSFERFSATLPIAP